ncbi:HbrB-domain-containing protein [Thelephora ganbajun]|uniref:HbrB-domain-containing protein n=1 Tax=Thelephora ganbajun TaxID=370292 RepID=A0ACB6ZU14_THEGA|nr:HbrB-domain-containing protein [Thelephora ganbajun]
MSPTVIPPERRPSASEELSRPSLQSLSHPGSDGGNGRGDSSGHFVGDAVSRRLGFLGVGDPKSSSTTFLPPRSHSRVDSNSNRDAPSNMSSSTLASVNKQHPSPSKGSMGRTYDSKLVSREMHRLGNFTHLNPTPFTHTTSSSTNLPQSVPNMSSSASPDNPWGALHVHVLPLFNGEPLRVPVEDLNTLVKRHVQSVVSAAPSKALATLENDTSALISSGMVTLNAKLTEIDDDKLVSRVVEIWGFFWDQVLPYVEGVLLPLQTDPLLSSLYRVNKSHRPSDAAGQTPNAQLPSHLLSSPQIDVRTVAIRAFRDQIIYPIFSRLSVCLTSSGAQDLALDNNYQQPRLQQMLLVLVSQGRQHSVSLSLTDPDPQPSAPEAAVQHLLRTVRLPLTQVSSNPAQTSRRAPSFLSDNQPRDRRGRIGEKPKNIKTSGDSGSSVRRRPMFERRNANGDAWNDDFVLIEDDEFGGEETPKMRKGGYGKGRWAAAQQLYFDEEREREREREFLESLRSPDIEAHENHRGSIGGWGLGNPHEEDTTKKHVMEDEDDELDWDQAQDAV